MRVISILSLIFPSRRTLRLTAYLVSVCTVAAALGARAVYAKAKQAGLEFGSQLAGLEELMQGRNTILVNGERFHRATVFSDLPLGEVLDRVQAACETVPGLLGQITMEAARLRPEAVKRSPFSPNILRGIVRHEEEDRGMVACFTGPRASGLHALAEASKRFTKTWNLGEFGRFRYAFAYRGEDGKTQVTTLLADTDLNVSTMFPKTGDAAGEDSRVLPRPQNSRRMLAAAAEGQPYAVRLYDSNESAAATLRFYDDWMKKQGWVAAGRVPGKGAGYLRPDGFQAIISATERKGRTSIALTEAGDSAGSLVSVTATVTP